MKELIMENLMLYKHVLLGGLHGVLAVAFAWLIWQASQQSSRKLFVWNLMVFALNMLMLVWHIIAGIGEWTDKEKVKPKPTPTHWLTQTNEDNNTDVGTRLSRRVLVLHTGSEGPRRIT